jgi:hypothetical protein
MADFTATLMVLGVWLLAEVLCLGIHLLTRIDRTLAGDRWEREQEMYR